MLHCRRAKGGEVNAVQEQAVDPNDVYDLGDAENLDQNGERVRQLAAKI